MDRDAYDRIIGQVRSNRRDNAAHKTDPNNGYMRGNALYGETGVPFPKGERKEKNKLRASRGDADLEAQERRKLAHEGHLIFVGQEKPVIVHADHDDIISHNVQGVSDKYAKRACLRLQHGPEATLPGFTLARDPLAEKRREVIPNPKSAFKRAKCSPIIVRV